MAAGFIKLDKPLEQVKMEIERNFSVAKYNELICDEVALPRRYITKCVFLYTTPGLKKINYVKQTRGNASKFRHNEVTSYDRFIVLGVEGTQHVLLMFTMTSEETRRLLTFNKHIAPGTPVWLLCGKVIGFLKNTQNPLIKTGDPLVPTNRGILYKSPPADVSIGSYVFFDFVATNFMVVQAVPKDNICTGRLCDAQGPSNNCGCLCAPPQKHWALSLTIKCDELSEKIIGEDAIAFTSTQATKLFVATIKRSEQLCSDQIDTYQMDDCVAALAAAVDKIQKFRVIGWFKPSQDDDGVAAGNFSYHICKLLPNSELNDYQQSLMYGARDVEIVSDNASTGFPPENFQFAGFPNLESMRHSAETSPTPSEYVAPHINFDGEENDSTSEM